MPCNLGLISRFKRDVAANFGIFAALATIPLLLSIGGAVDLAALHSATTQMQDVVDGAALAAAKRMETGTLADAKAEADLFIRLNMAKDQSGSTVTSAVDTAAGTVTVTAKGAVRPIFLKFARIDNLPFQRTAMSSIRKKGYMDFHFLIDVSESMNIAASEADRKTLEAITKSVNNRPCAFACHVVEPGWSRFSVYQMNENAGAGKAKLRIDVLRSAANSMIDRLLSLNGKPAEFIDVRLQTGGFGTAYEKGVGPTNNADALKASLTGFVVANSHTSYAPSLTSFSVALGAQGDGTSSSSPRKVAMLITDGVRDEGFARAQLGPIPSALCDQIKSKGIDLAILEISYVENYDVGNFFRDRVAWYFPQISPALKSCASPGLYYKVADSEQAADALILLSNKLVMKGMRITQ